MSRLEATRENVPQSFYCLITQQIMKDPVICADGHSYEKAGISRWFETHDTSPLTNLPLPNKKLTPNFALKNAIEEFFQGEKIPDEESTQQAIDSVESYTQLLLTTSLRRASEGDYPIHCAVRRRNVLMLAGLLNNDNLKLKNKSGKTAIELAAYLGNWDLVIDIATAYKPDRQMSYDNDICTAYDRVLHVALRENKILVFIELKNAGAIEHHNAAGNYAIHDAITHRNTIILDHLLNNHNLALKNKAGKTAIELAADLGHWDLVSNIANAYKPNRHIRCDGSICAAYDKVLGIAASEGRTIAFAALKNAGAITTNVVMTRETRPKKPSIARLKKNYISNVTFFSFQVREIFKGDDVDEVIKRLKDRGKGGASEKTLKAFKLL